MILRKVRADIICLGGIKTIIRFLFISAGSSDYSYFNINQNDGTITTATVLQHSARENYTVSVLVRDEGSPPRQSSYEYRVRVLSSADPSLPFSLTNLVFRVPENLGLGAVVGSVRPSSGSSQDSGVWFSLLQSESREAAAVFDIENQSGDLVLTAPLDADGAAAEYNLRVALNDAEWGLARQVIRVRVLVTDVNDSPPVFPASPVQLAVSEAAVLGEAVAAVTARDLDQGGAGSLRYSLGPQLPAEYFRVDPLSGQLFLTRQLSYEAAPRVFLTVRATDSPGTTRGRHTSDVAVIVTVEDVNDHAPEFVSVSQKQIQRSVDLGVPFHRVLAVDADSGAAGEVEYLLVAGDPDNTFTLDPDTGLLSASSRPRRSSYRLTVQASDRGPGPAQAARQQLEISVAEVSAGPPKFSQAVYSAQVPENSGAGAAVAAVRAEAQGNTQLVYSLDDTLAFGLFTIDRGSGAISAVRELDREERAGYLLTVYVHDSASPPSFDTATVLVRVTDENDHAPEFQDSCYPLSVPENTDLANIHQMVAIDLDEKENGAITYSLTAAGPSRGKFSIDAQTGQLSAAPLDHEDAASHQLTITAEDAGSPRRRAQCELVVRVLDRNDNAPVFSQQRYAATVAENTAEGSAVTTVLATDADSGQNAKISYSIRNGTQWIFGIDKDSGEVFTTGKLDREERAEYVLEVVAVDEGVEDTRMAVAEVRITVEDVNDNQPQFDEYPFTAKILPQHPPGAEIVRVAASDRDSGANSDLKFSFLNPSDGEKFSLDPGTGVISSRSSLAAEDGKMFHLEVEVSRVPNFDIQYVLYATKTTNICRYLYIYNIYMTMKLKLIVTLSCTEECE